MPKLTRRLLLYFSAALIVFTVVLAGLFDMLLRDASAKQNRVLLEQRTQALAASLSAVPASPPRNNSEVYGMQGQMMHGGMHMRGMHHMAGSAMDERHIGPSYCRRYINDTDVTSSADTIEDAAYLKNLSALAGGTVWLVDRSTKTITAFGASAGESYGALPAEALAMLDAVYKGNTVSSEGFNELLDAPSFTAAAPIKNSTGEITGALLVHQTLAALAESELSGLHILGAAIVAAFILALILSLLLARRFVRPLECMEKTAAVLAEGDYTARTQIKQSDEIGSLAKSLDKLAIRLSAADRERMQLEKMRRDFLSSISHELRTPLTVLRGTLDLLASGLTLSKEKEQSLLEQTMSQTTQLERLINDLFELTRLENPDFTIEKTTGSITDALMDAMRAADRLADEKKVHIRMLSSCTPIVTDMDYGRIRQMFLTVLDNAVKFSPEDSSIDIHTENSGNGWSISIRDHGPGIDPLLLPGLFTRFRSQRSENNPDGTGLGLAIAKQIAERHSITLTASNAENGGAVFTFNGTI